MARRRKPHRFRAARIATVASACVCARLHAGAVDLDELFAPPSAAEIAAVRADWASRFPEVVDWRTDASGVNAAGYELRVVSHVMDGARHYAILRLPPQLVAGASGPFPVVLCLHGGAEGVANGIFGTFDWLAGTGVGACAGQPAILVAPSFRGEPANAGALGTFLSEGESVQGDRDVDDAIALLSGVLASIPEADEGHVAAWGFSRGGGVVIKLLARDHRVRAGTDFFGPTDVLTPERQASAEALIDGGLCKNPDVGEWQVVCDYVEGAIPLSEARLHLVRRSGLHFVEQIERIDVHHGALDDLIPIEQSERLVAAAATATPRPLHRYFAYPSGIHQVTSLSGAPTRFREFLCAAYQLPAPCPGDVDLDGQVNGADLTLLLGMWGTVTATSRADFDGNRAVDAGDLALILGNWGACATR